MVRTPERDSPCTSTPMSNAHLRIGNGLHPTALESGLRTRGSKHTVDHSLMTGRYEADPHLDEAAETAVEPSSAAPSSMPQRTFPKRSIPRRAAAMVTGAYGWVIEP